MNENDAPKQPKKDLTPWEALGVVWEIGTAIAIPTILFALLGRWVDRRYGTSPFFIIAGLFLALVVITVFTVKKGKKIARKL